MVDVELVTRKLTLVGEDLRALEPLSALSVAAFATGGVNQALAERYLERAIGRMIDVNYHLITELGAAPPRDYFESFVRLADHGVMDSQFARRIASCAGLRNRIAHEYDDIDPAKLHDALRGAMVDVPLYAQHVARFLDSLPS
jgi:uncharacterized protein YutE (UPF0331/DUF86 family)